MSDNINQLSPSEKEIWTLILAGETSAQIAKLRGCSTRTVEKHRSNIIKKLKVPKGRSLRQWIISQNVDKFDF